MPDSSVNIVCVPTYADLLIMRAFLGGVTSSIWTISVAPFDTVLFPEKQDTQMVVWCLSPKGRPSICRHLLVGSVLAPDQTSEGDLWKVPVMFPSAVLWSSVWICLNETEVANPCPLIPARDMEMGHHKHPCCAQTRSIRHPVFIGVHPHGHLRMLLTSTSLLILSPPLPTSSLHFLPPPTHSFLPLFAFAASLHFQRQCLTFLCWITPLHSRHAVRLNLKEASCVGENRGKVFVMLIIYIHRSACIFLFGMCVFTRCFCFCVTWAEKIAAAASCLQRFSRFAHVVQQWKKWQMLFVKHTHRLEKSTPARVRIVFTLLPQHVCDVFTFKTGVTSVCGLVLVLLVLFDW